MSEALVDKAGLRWWSEEELDQREYYFKRINTVIQQALLHMNRAWSFHRIESPMLVPTSMVSDAYTTDDVFFTQDHPYAMRPETTAGSYKAMDKIIRNTKVKPPMCVYQMGKSFRVEKADGASASKLRYNEFTQAEWQCLYSNTTQADYKTWVLRLLEIEVESWFKYEVRIVDSDRLPSYSIDTKDLEVWYMIVGLK
jgi:glycyl-tRNA synthetase